MNELVIWHKAHARHPEYHEWVLTMLDDGELIFAYMDKIDDEDVWLDTIGPVRVQWWASVEGPV